MPFELVLSPATLSVLPLCWRNSFTLRFFTHFPFDEEISPLNSLDSDELPLNLNFLNDVGYSVFIALLTSGPEAAPEKPRAGAVRVTESSVAAATRTARISADALPCGRSIVHHVRFPSGHVASRFSHRQRRVRS